MAARSLPKAEDFLQSYDFCPETGRLLRKPKPVDYSKRPRDINRAIRWNEEMAGTEAGWIDPSTGYRKISSLNQDWPLHRIIWMLHYGEDPKEWIDHINGDRSDNRITNLRVATPSENCRNRPVKCVSNTGYLGVSWCKRRRRFRPTISVDGKQRTLGDFKTLEEAYAARLKAARENGFTERHLATKDAH